MSKKIVSLTLPETLVERVDEKVEEVGAKSRSAFISEIIEQSLSGRAFSLTDEEHQALQVCAETVQMSPEEVVKFVLDRIILSGARAVALDKTRLLW